MNRGAYLAHLLTLGLPVLALQLAVATWRYRQRLPAVLSALAVPVLATAAWLTLGDELAIRSGLWRFDARLLLGWRVGHVPVEEPLFFLLSGLLVGLSVALLRPDAHAAGGPA